jgi:hypothetical protein
MAPFFTEVTCVGHMSFYSRHNSSAFAQPTLNTVNTQINTTVITVIINHHVDHSFTSFLQPHLDCEHAGWPILLAQSRTREKQIYYGMPWCIVLSVIPREI